MKRKKPEQFKSVEFSYTIIIPAYNEKGILDKKLANTKQFAGATTQIILVTSGSTDGSNQLQYEGVLHIHTPQRKGKPAAINEGLQQATGDIIICTDANAMLSSNTLLRCQHLFSNPTVGMITAKKQVASAADTESNYWELENTLKKLETDAGSCSSGVGEFMAVRKELFNPIPNDLILDDFYVSQQVLQAGYTIQYDDTIQATELGTNNLYHEYNRRTRIAAGALQWTVKYLTGTRHSYLWQLYSNKIGRWFLAPMAILYLFIHSLLHATTLTVTIFVCIVAAYFISKLSRSLRRLAFPFYFIFIHICMLIGYAKFLMGTATVIWKKQNR